MWPATSSTGRCLWRPWRQMAEADHCDTLFLDVRTREGTRLRAIPGSVNIPLDELRGRIGELPRDKGLHLLRRWSTGIPGLENSDGTRVYRVKKLSGGYKTYATATAPIENKTATIRTNSKTDTQHTGERIKTLKIDACGLQCPGSHEDQTGDRLDRRRRRSKWSPPTPGFSRDAQA